MKTLIITLAVLCLVATKHLRFSRILNCTTLADKRCLKWQEISSIYYHKYQSLFCFP